MGFLLEVMKVFYNCEYTKNHCIAHFILVNCMVQGFYQKKKKQVSTRNSVSSINKIYLSTEKQVHCLNILQLVLSCNTISRARSLYEIKNVYVLNKIKQNAVTHTYKPCRSLLMSARKSAPYSEN